MAIPEILIMRIINTANDPHTVVILLSLLTLIMPKAVRSIKAAVKALTNTSAQPRNSRITSLFSSTNSEVPSSIIFEVSVKELSQ